ncbi:MAG: hypothetical protein HC896_01695 [Bacteroidales bacterium]|nr:hypothetical protein [Bacteroidales bacterium]
MGISTDLALMERFSVHAEYAMSAYTRDTRMPEIYYDKYTYLNNLGGIFTPRNTTRVNGCFNGSVTYSAEKFNVNLGYRRVAPEYITLGSTYLANDLEDYTLGAGTSFIKGKGNISGNLGFQRNNLDDNLENITKRFIGSATVSYAFTTQLGASLNYANFSSKTGPDYVTFADSASFIQATSNIGATLTYSWGEGINSRPI